MNDQTDSQLLRAYAERRSEPAFAELVRRHVDFVYSAALRMVCDSHLAQDVTQGVFVALAKDATQLTDRPVLSGWLHRTAQNIAAQTVRSEVRRRAREQEAAAMNELLSAEPDAVWERIAPHLDAALGELSEADRDALLLRYFERKSAREIAQALGVSDEAAQKRVSRAVERLREFFAKQGVTVGASGLVVVISANAVQAAPVGLATAVSTAAALAGTSIATTATVAATNTMTMTALQITLVTATIAALAGTGIYEAHQASHLRAQITAIQQQRMPPHVSSNDAAASALQDKVDLLAAQNAKLSNALTRANTDKARLEKEREQAKHVAALFKELAAQASSKDNDSTNRFPTLRHVWAGWGRLGQLSVQFNKDDSNLSPEEKAAIATARVNAVGEIVNLVKAEKQLEKDKPSGSDSPLDDSSDYIACVLYGALSLDEHQFGEVYGLLEKYRQQAREKGLLQENSAQETAAALNQAKEQIIADVQSLLTPEQARIFEGIVPLFQVSPHKIDFGFKWSP